MRFAVCGLEMPHAAHFFNTHSIIGFTMVLAFRPYLAMDANPEKSRSQYDVPC